MKPHIYVVGIGPGSQAGMTLEAKAVLEGCDCIVGYHTYIDLIRGYFPDKEFVVTGMTQEVARCRLVLERALKGQKVAIVSSGDAGIYGMAGIMHEVAADTPDVDIEVIPGVTAASAGAALLGAPLIADACLISLSDLLTPWDKIENRLDCAAAGDFVICLYNPASKKRADYLEKACDIILRHQSAHTPVGIVRNIGRDGQAVKILTLGELRTQHLDMFCTVFIGNSQTKVLNGKLVTPRGYRL
ncbi:precorrin-3B C(17)-methyltransferase [Megasphaera sp.]|uniref:precorrin-3B C(17)-methyltransferase n=1 Tax=Megasphaera sp. TaxID=2023260 RepID=UPI0027B996C0|nr:precorrin-3B C(17)-methyltransferase [Megasphaera sp.]